MVEGRALVSAGLVPAVEGLAARVSAVRDEEPSCRIRCVSNTDIEVGPRDGGGATAADTGAIGSMGRGGGAGMGPSTGKGRGFFLGGGPDELASGRAPEELASRGVEAAEEETRGRFFCWLKNWTVTSEYPRGRGSPGWSRTWLVYQTESVRNEN